MSAQSNAAPVIIKRKKIIAAGGHHGGAWKVAYADFVTAMMAFFLLMWLLNATTEKQRKGLADYFSPTVPISRVSGGDDGHFGGESVFAEDALSKDGLGATDRNPAESVQALGDTGVTIQEDRELEALKEKLDNALRGTNGESMISPELQRHIITRVTDEGLLIELFDTAEGTLFEDGSDAPTALLNALVAVLVEMSALVTNSAAVEGHVRAAPVVLKSYPAWDLSTARAQQMRLLLTSAGLAGSRVARVTGHADRDPAVRNPMAVRNNRLELIFLRKGA
ncbi:chemotaxis protein MotB [Pelagivirga sediminicola]|uniref:Chemotaxis protein MotB n=1 Tax=Pelagivirga sediminicola TaxID=2170575 RepID=A0A2T7G8C1_9RHOB|nr:flagellar motor protein MotB [Pelagivirga sediminicola]PVA10669.1 chemotaxis protein MotB [Pelagivirga sediminicola]